MFMLNKISESKSVNTLNMPLNKNYLISLLAVRWIYNYFRNFVF